MGQNGKGSADAGSVGVRSSILRWSIMARYTMIDNIMIGRLWLCWVGEYGNRRGRGYVDSQGKRRLGLIWVRIGRLQIMWYTRHYPRPRRPFIRSLN